MMLTLTRYIALIINKILVNTVLWKILTDITKSDFLFYYINERKKNTDISWNWHVLGEYLGTSKKKFWDVSRYRVELPQSQLFLALWPIILTNCKHWLIWFHLPSLWSALLIIQIWRPRRQAQDWSVHKCWLVANRMSVYMRETETAMWDMYEFQEELQLLWKCRSLNC